MALSVKVGVQLKDVKNIKNEVQSKLDSMSKQLKISPQKINLGNINNLRTELQAKLDQVTKNLKLNLSGINISGVDTAKIKESLGDVKVKPKLDTGQIIADTNTLVSQIRSKVESAVSGGTIGKISINTGSNGEFLGAKVTAQLDNADTKVIKLNKDLEILGETFNQNSSKMANALASQNKYLDSQITKLKTYKQAVQGSGGGSVSKQVELNNALDVQIRKLEQLKTSNELLGNAEKTRINEATNALKTQTNQLTKYDSSFKNTFSRMLQYFGSGSIIYGFVNQVKTGVNQIIELDDAMRDLRKVADATTEQLEGFTKVANGMAKEVGASTEGIVKSTELYSKLGYAIDEASERAKNANIFSNISDMDIDDATKALITIQKGFGMDSMEDMMTIMDATNEVGNKFSSSTQDIAEGLKEFSSTSLEAGNNLQESIGLFVSANASIQDSSRAGNALKTIIMRLRGMSTELDETGVPASKLRESIKSITASAGQMVDIMKDDNTFKSTTEILKELSEVYPKLTDAQKAWMQKNIAGVHQGNVYASIMKNMQEGIDATSTALDSNGSALKENAIYMDSASAKINEFKESLKEVWINTIDSSTIKGVVEGGTAILNVFNKMTTTFGAFPTVISTVVAGLSLFNSKARESMGMFTNALPVVGKFSIKLQTLGEQYKKSASDIQTQITKLKVQQASMNATGGSVDGFNSKLSTLSKQLLMTNVKLAATKLATMALQSVLSFGLSFAISEAINLFTKLGDSVLHPEKRIEELQEAMDSFNSSNESNKTFEEDLSSYEKVTSELNNANLTLDERKSKLEEIESLKSSLSSYDSQISGILNNQNLTYDEQIAKLKMISEEKQKQNAEDLEETLKGGFFDTDQGVKAEQQLENLDKYIARLKEYQDLANNNNVGDTVKTQAWGKMELGSDEWDEKVKDTQTKIKELYLSIDEYNQAVASMGDYTDRKQVAVSDEVRNYVLSLMKVSDETAKAVGGVDGLTDSYGGQTPKVKDATTALQEYADSVNGTEWSKDLSPTEIYGKAISEVETLQGYINDMNSETGYTAQLVSEIAQKYPEIGARVTDAEQVQQFLNDKIAEQVDIQNQAYEIMVGNDTEFYNSKIAKNEEFKQSVDNMLKAFVDEHGRAYEADWGAYTTLNEMKQDVLGKFAQGINDFLGQFVDGNGQAYQVDLQNFNNLTQAKAEALQKLNSLLKQLQQNTITSLGAQQQAYNEMSAMATGGVLGLEKAKKGAKRFDQMAKDTAIMNAYAENAKKIADVKGKIKEIENLDGLDLKGYSPQTYNGSAFSPSSGGKGGSGSGSSAKEGTYLQDLYDRYSELQKAIDRCANAYDLLEEKKKNASDKDKLKYIKEQIDLINKQKDAVNALRNEQQKQYNELKGYLQGKGFNINSDGAITNYSRIKELTAWAGTNDERKEEVEAINDAIEEFNDLVQNDMPKSRKEFESLTNTVAELNEEMKDIYKSELELVTDAQEEVVDIIKDRLDKQKELLDKEYEDRKEALEKTKKLYQDQNAEEDYAEELAEEQKKLDEMKNSLIDLQRDVSGNSDALIADMKKQIEEQEKVIRDKQKQYERDKTEQALDQAIEDIENEKEAMDKQWEEQYSEANIVQMATQALNTGLINLNGEVVSLQDAMIAFENETGQGKLYTSPYVQKCA